MTKADWLVLAGFLLLIAGAATIHRALGLLVAGGVCLFVARAALNKRPAPSRLRREDFE
jgi:hypothetical protein